VEYESRRHCVTSIGWQDPRGLDDDGESLVSLPDRWPRDGDAAVILDERENALMWPERFDRKAVERLKEGLGPYFASGRLQQSPTPKGGGIFDRAWWQLWESPDGKFPFCDYVVASLDGAFTEDEENDPSALTIWGTFRDEQKRRRIVLLNAWRKHLKFSGPRIERLIESTVIDGQLWPADAVMPGMPRAVVETRNKLYKQRCQKQWGLVEWVADSCNRFKVNTLLIEGKASGISAAQELGNRHANEGWSIAVLPVKGDKVARALAAQPVFSQLAVYAPDREWAELVISEMSVFPKGRFDDLTDSTCQAINYLRGIGMARSDDEAADDEVRAAMPRGRMKALYPV
jgi:predicted phage terminase large subunit-like protein